MTEKELLDLKRRIEQAENEAAQLEGQRTVLLEQLKEHGVDSVKAGEKRIAEMEDELETLETDLRRATQAVEEKYNALS